ncbi:MAG: hypothetical protein JSS76_10975 [Bacteroidetes bacterium]|nr:hypothetical protein [Bacteroidota bacterium]
MNTATITIYNVNGSDRTIEYTSKELKDNIIPDNGMPFSMSIDITDSKGATITISFGTDGNCTIYKDAQ